VEVIQCVGLWDVLWLGCATAALRAERNAVVAWSHHFCSPRLFALLINAAVEKILAASLPPPTIPALFSHHSKPTHYGPHLQ